MSPLERNQARAAIGAALARVRRRWQLRHGIDALAWLVGLTLATVVIGAIVLWVELGAARGLRIAGLAGLAIAAILLLVRVFRRRAAESQVALYVEENEATLGQVLVSAVESPEPPVEAPLADRLLTRAVDGLKSVDDGLRVERPKLRRSSTRLAGVTLGSVLLVGLGPASLRDAARTIFAPWKPVPEKPVFALAVDPGDATVPRGGALEIHATPSGFTTQLAELVTRRDSATEWERVPMVRDSSGSFESRMFDLAKNTEYFVEAEGVRSATYRLTVEDLPAVELITASIQPPAYTGLPAERVDSAGDLAVLEGSTVTLRARTTKPAKAGSLLLEGAEPIAMRAVSDSEYVASFRVRKDGFYRIELTTPDGRPVRASLQYAIDALEDAPPTVAFTAPGRDTKATSVDEVTTRAHAADDYGVRKLALHVSANGGAEQVVTLADTTLRILRELDAAHTFFLEEMGLKPGDVVSYFARATDGAGHSASSDIYFLEIRPFDKTYRQAEQGGGGQGGGESAEGLSEQQRQIVVGTFNVLRDSATTPPTAWRENVTTLAIGQGRLREDVNGLVTRLRQRGLAGADSTFNQIATELSQALTEMGAAEENLGKRAPRTALPAEQRALQHLQRAEAAYREVQVAMGQSQGGGGNSKSSNAEELADLFELETDKLKNQYESVQQQANSESERKLDETMEKLKRLASRQQQENERMQRMADAMRGKSSGGGGGGGGSSQRELAKEAEESARQLERLAREKSSEQLADAARRLAEAAEAMRKAATASGEQGAAQGAAALERLKSASRQVDRARGDQARQEVEKLLSRAQSLQQAQRDVAQGAGSLPANPTERAQKTADLGERKDAMTAEAERLQADLDRLGREMRREQAKTAGKLEEAAESMRQGRIRDKLAYSKQLLRGGSPEYIKSFEQQLGENLGELTNKIRDAVGALGSSPERQQAQALDRARDLVRGLESLRERARAQLGQAGDSTRLGAAGGREPGREGQPGAEGQRNQPGQRGEQGEKGQGQQGEKGQGQQGEKGQGQQGEKGQGQGEKGQGQGEKGQGQQGEKGEQGKGQQGGKGEQGQEGQSGQAGQGQGQQNGQPGQGGQPGTTRGGDIRQFQRELRGQRIAGDSLRRELAAMGQDVRDLDRLLAALGRLDNTSTFGEVQGLDQLERDVIAGLKEFEFALWRKLEGAGSDRPAIGPSSRIPPAYRELVEEYYRSLARDRAAPKPARP